MMTPIENSAATSSSDISKPPFIEKIDVAKDAEATISRVSTVLSKEKDDGLAQDPLSGLSHIDTSDYPSAFPLAMIMIALILTVFLSALDMTIVATAIPRITDQFHSLDEVGWYGSAFFLTVAAFQSTWGKAYKYFPLKTTFLLSIFVFEIGSLICGVANNSTTLIVGRAVAGLGGAGITSGCYTIIGFSAPPRQRPAFTGLTGATFGVASVLGPLLGGIFVSCPSAILHVLSRPSEISFVADGTFVQQTDHLSWRWCFYINLPIGGVSGVIILLFFRTPQAARPQQASLVEKLWQMDFPGTFTIMAATCCYLLAMQWGGTSKAWNSSDVIGTLVGFGLLIIVFIVIEYFSGDRALLQGRLLKDRTLMAVSAYIFMVAGVFFTMVYYLPIYFQATRNVSAAKSGIDNLPLVVAASLFSIVSGGLLTVWGHYIPIMVFGSIVASIGAGLVYSLEIHTGSSKWIGYQALVGIGTGLIFQIPVIVAQAVVKPADLSSVTAMILFFQTGGGAIFISAAQAGFANKLLHRLASTAPDVDASLVLTTGATDLHKVFSAAQMPGILSAYMDGLKVPFAISIACACLTFLLSFMPRWESIRGKIPMAGGAA